MKFVALTVFTLPVVLVIGAAGCARSPTKPSEPQHTSSPGSAAPSSTPEKAASLTESPRPELVDIPVPEEIKKELLSDQDVKEGAELRAQTIPIDSPDTRLLVSATGRFMCSPTGNCPRWIFRNTSTGWKPEVELGEVQSVRLEPSDGQAPYLVAQQHGSALESGLYVYRFDGTRYGLVKCASQSYADPNDSARILDTPIVTEIPCR